MGITQKLHQLAKDACTLANIVGPTEQQRSISFSLDFIDRAFLALRGIIGNLTDKEITLETTWKSFIYSWLRRLP